MTDREAVYALARSFLDWLPPVKVARYDPTRAEAASSRETCPSCKGRGERRVRGVWAWCDRCERTGWIKVDAYTRREIAEQQTLPIHLELEQHFAVVNRDAATRGSLRTAEQHRNDQQLRALLRDAGHDDGEDALDYAFRQRDDMYARGAYAELAQAQRLLAQFAPVAHRRWWLIVVEGHGWLYRRDERLGQLLDATADRLAGWMPTRPIRVPHDARAAERRARARAVGKTPAHDRQRAERDALVRAMAADGMTPAEIAAHAQVAVSVRRVQQILADELEPVASGPAA